MQSLAPRDRLANPFVMTRNFVIVISHILKILEDKVEPTKEYPRGYSAKWLGDDIYNITGVSKYKGNKYISPLINGHLIVSSEEHAELVGALNNIMEGYEAGPCPNVYDVPLGLLMQYEGHLRRLYGDDATYRPRAVPELGDRLSNALQGMWRLFYVPPDILTTRTIVTNVAFFHNGGSRGGTALGLLMGPNNTRWIASATRTVADYVQLSWSQSGGTESSSCIAYIDDIGVVAPKLAGVLAVLEQRETGPVPYRPRKLIGTLCFGTRCTLDDCGLGSISKGESPPDEDERLRLENVVSEALRGSALSVVEGDLLRKYFRDVRLSIDDLHMFFPSIAPYLREIRDQDRLFFGSESLEILCRGADQTT